MAAPAPAPDQRGNAAKRVAVVKLPPWKSTRWRRMSRHGRAIAFQEKYCRSPKGVGHGKPLRLGRFQKEFLEEALADGIEAAVLTTARGNGKSTEGGGLATWAAFDDDETGAPQVPVVATTVGQAIKSCYGVAVAMIEMEPELRDRCLIYTGVATPRVVVPYNRAELFPISNDVDGLQGLDPSLAVIDEIGFQPIESYAALKLAGGKRQRSLLLGLGTKGINPNNALEHLRRQVHEKGGLPGLVYREYSTPAGYRVDDPAGWRLASPALREGFLRESVIASDLALPEALFRIFRLNQTIEGVDSWLGENAAIIWDGLVDVRAPEPKAPTWVGIDVGLKRDSTAVVYVQRLDDGLLHAWCKLWIPTADRPVDITDVMEYLRKLSRLFKVEQISYDARFFDVPAKILADERLPMKEVPQTVERMTPIIGGLYDLLRGGGLRHTGDLAFRQHILNAQARYNSVGFTLEKLKSNGRIDAAIALALAVHPALGARPRRPYRPRVVRGR